LLNKENISDNTEQRDDKLKLKYLLQITQAINNNFSRTQLLRIYENILKSRPYIKRFMLFTVHGDQTVRQLHYGFTDFEFIGFSTENLMNLLGLPEEVRFMPTSDSVFYNLIIPTHHKAKPLAFLLVDATYDFSVEDELADVEKADVEFLQTLTNVVFVALENKKLAKENLNQEILKKEIELASELQAMLFPPNWNVGRCNMEIDAFHKTFTDVGGDYYDFFPINDTETAFCIADVSGKGVSAALLMSNFQASVRSLFRYEQDLGKLATILNEQVDSSAKGEKFITVFLAKYNSDTRVLNYVNCGHNPPFLLMEKESKWLTEGVPGLGMLPEMKNVKSYQIQVKQDALLVCYTDGITECENVEGQFFGQESLREIILNNKSLSPAELNRQIMYKLNGFVNDRNKYQDDVALLTCKFV
jgi:sigma-B regulation protein RsbU (phosphoserine phosphatase)